MEGVAALGLTRMRDASDEQVAALTLRSLELFASAYDPPAVKAQSQAQAQPHGQGQGLGQGQGQTFAGMQTVSNVPTAERRLTPEDLTALLVALERAVVFADQRPLSSIEADGLRSGARGNLAADRVELLHLLRNERPDLRAWLGAEVLEARLQLKGKPVRSAYAQAHIERRDFMGAALAATIELTALEAVMRKSFPTGATKDEVARLVRSKLLSKPLSEAVVDWSELQERVFCWHQLEGLTKPEALLDLVDGAYAAPFRAATTAAQTFQKEHLDAIQCHLAGSPPSRDDIMMVERRLSLAAEEALSSHMDLYLLRHGLTKRAFQRLLARSSLKFGEVRKLSVDWVEHINNPKWRREAVGAVLLDAHNKPPKRRWSLPADPTQLW